jgi:phospholipid/cholesterol/gamma-HCH transport system substrate-binding protein
MADSVARSDEVEERPSLWAAHWPLIRILIAAGFTFSCFGLLIFVWVSFGGWVPLRAESYRFTADFGEAITLQKEADARIGGVSVGKVKDVSLAKHGNAASVTIELDPQYAPISSDARAILRQKTLLGETYVELTAGTKNSAEGAAVINTTSTAPTAAVGQTDTLVGPHATNPIPEGGHLPDSQVQDQVQIDEIFNALDAPTREAFRVWQQNLAIGAAGRGQDLSDAFGNLGPFAQDASNVLRILNDQSASLSQLVSSTGTVFNALSQKDAQLQELIRGNNQTFGALAARDKALSEAIRIFPTFNTEAKKTLDRLKTFSKNAQPLARDLKPVARNLSPALADLRTLTPPLKSLFVNLGPLTDAETTGLPALRSTLHELKPVFDGLDPFLANLNPILRYVDAYSGNVTDFIANPETGIADTLPPVGPQPAARHALRQVGLISPETLSVYPTRPATNRGQGYVPPLNLNSISAATYGETFGNHDCNNTGATGGLGSGQVTSNPPSNPQPSVGLFPLGEFTPATPPFINGGITIFAPCTITTSPFGGGPVPFVPQD